MVEIKKYLPAEVIPQQDLQAWRSQITRSEAPACPPEVREFITAMAAKLPDFGRTGEFTTLISGRDLILSGLKTWKGEQIFSFAKYPLQVPYMHAQDHEAGMHRIFARQGKQGIINYCKARVKDTEFQKILAVLTVHVFKQERPEFTQLMADIEAGKKIDSKLDV